jgi:hypothetical protein
MNQEKTACKAVCVLGDVVPVYQFLKDNHKKVWRRFYNTLEATGS